MQNDELINALQVAATQTERVDIYGKLYENNRGIIKIKCDRWERRLRITSDVKNPLISLDDIIQESYFALVQAADNYSKATPEQRQIAFTTYLTNSIDWYFIRYFGKRHKYIADERYILRLDRNNDPNDSESPTLADITPDENQNIERNCLDRLYSEECEKVFIDTIKDYPPLIKDVLFRRILLGQTLKTIGDSYGKSTEHIRQIYRDGKQKLNQSDIRERLSESIEADDIQSMAYRKSGFKFWKENNFTSSVEYAAIKLEERRGTRTRRRTTYNKPSRLDIRIAALQTKADNLMQKYDTAPPTKQKSMLDEYERLIEQLADLRCRIT